MDNKRIEELEQQCWNKWHFDKKKFAELIWEEAYEAGYNSGLDAGFGAGYDQAASNES